MSNVAYVYLEGSLSMFHRLMVLKSSTLSLCAKFWEWEPQHFLDDTRQVPTKLDKSLIFGSSINDTLERMLFLHFSSLSKTSSLTSYCQWRFKYFTVSRRHPTRIILNSSLGHLLPVATCKLQSFHKRVHTSKVERFKEISRKAFFWQHSQWWSWMNERFCPLCLYCPLCLKIPHLAGFY